MAGALRPLPALPPTKTPPSLAVPAVQDAEEVMQQLALPRALRRKIRTYYADQWVPPDEGEPGALYVCGHPGAAEKH